MYFNECLPEVKLPTPKAARRVPLFFYVAAVLVVLILGQMLREVHNANAWQQWRACEDAKASTHAQTQTMEDVFDQISKPTPPPGQGEKGDALRRLMAAREPQLFSDEEIRAASQTCELSKW
jgi:hypothetical protein